MQEKLDGYRLQEATSGTEQRRRVKITHPQTIKAFLVIPYEK
jgi:hypothetical protein